jgi:D-amino peptidase
MKILISADIEGVAGVFHPEQTRPGNGEYERARRWMTEEANAAIRGAFDGGATEVLVNDSHGSFRNLLVDALDPRARQILGKPRALGMMAGLEQQCHGVMMLGYHSQAQGRGVLAHTMNSFAFARVEINGQALGEAGLYGALAGEFGVPVLFGSGDDQFIVENTPFFPGALWVQTKLAYGLTSGLSMSPAEAQTAIAESAERAVRDLGQATGMIAPVRSTLHAQDPAVAPQPFCLATPIVCRLTTQSPALADLFCTLPFLSRRDGVMVEFSAATIQNTIRILNSLSAMSFMLRS